MSKMKQIWSGQSFLFREDGYDSTVVEVRMKDRISGADLQTALNTTAARYPYITDKLVEKDGKYYLAPSNTSMIATATKKYRSLGSMATGYHLLDVTYVGRIIRVAFHHGLCDGVGVMPFVTKLIGEYCRERYHRGVQNTVKEVPDAAETREPFGTEFLEAEPTEPMIFPEKYVLPEATGTPEATYRTEYRIDEEEFVAYAKSIGATPAILLSMLFSDSVYNVHPQAENTVTCSMAMDMRPALGCEGTHCNCVGSAYLPYSVDDRTRDRREVVGEMRDLMKKQRDPNAVKQSINRQIGMFNKLDEMQSLEEKRQAFSFFNTMIPSTYVLSYLGRLDIGADNEHIENACFYSAGIRGITVNMLCASGTITLELLQGFEGCAYAEALMHALEPYGLISVSNTEPVVTGKDKSYITASRQAERFFIKTNKGENRVIQFFKRAFADMKASAKAQHEVDRANFAAARAESRANFEEARAMGHRDTRLALEQRRRDAQIADANARIAAANERTKQAKYGKK